MNRLDDKFCPKCHQPSPAFTKRCKCGHWFPTVAVAPTPTSQIQKPINHMAAIIAVSCLFGLVLIVGLISALSGSLGLGEPLNVNFTFSGSGSSVVCVTNASNSDVYDVGLEPYAMLLIPTGNDLDPLPDRKRVPVGCSVEQGNPAKLAPGESVYFRVGTTYEMIGYECLWAHYRASPTGEEKRYEPNYTARAGPYRGD